MIPSVQNNSENLAVILEQLKNLANSMSKVESALQSVDDRLSALEKNDEGFRARFDERLNSAYERLGEHDGVASESRADRARLRDDITSLNLRVHTLELKMASINWFGIIVIGLVIADIFGRFMKLI